MKHQVQRLLPILVAAAFMKPAGGTENETEVDKDVRGPRDLALTYRSDFDNANRPYRLYLPSGSDEQVRLGRDDVGRWKATVEPRNVRPYTDFRTHKVGHVAASPTADGEAETLMGSWITDAVRDATEK